MLHAAPGTPIHVRIFAKSFMRMIILDVLPKFLPGSVKNLDD